MDFVDKKLGTSVYKVYKETDDSIIYAFVLNKPTKTGVTEYALSIDLPDSEVGRCYITHWGNIKDVDGIDDVVPVGIPLIWLKLLYFKAQKMRFKRFVKRAWNKVKKVVHLPGKKDEELVNDHISYEAANKNKKTVKFGEKENKDE